MTAAPLNNSYAKRLKVKHTPGPYVSRPSKARDGTSIWTADGVRCIAQMVRLEDSPLLATAPDLLAALKMLREIDDAYGFDLNEQQRDQMHDAIAKAGG